MKVSADIAQKLGVCQLMITMTTNFRFNASLTAFEEKSSYAGMLRRNLMELIRANIGSSILVHVYVLVKVKLQKPLFEPISGLGSDLPRNSRE